MSTQDSVSFIQPYLFFGGRCEEAIEFYCEAIGAEVEMVMRYSECPDPMPPEMLAPGFENKIMHAAFRIGQSTVMASDGCGGESPPISGFSLSLSLPDAVACEKAFSALSDGGKVNMPLGETFWSPCFGMLEDRFGIGWMVTTIPDCGK